MKKRFLLAIKTALPAVLCLLLLASCKESAPNVPSAMPSAAAPTDTTPAAPAGDPIFSLGEIYKRYYAEPVTEFIPGEYPSRVLPFLGGEYKVEASYGGFGSMRRFGFCLETGEVVCDPYYSYIDAVTSGEKTVYIALKPLPEQESGFFMEYEHTVVTADGKTAKRYDRVSFIGETDAAGYLSVNDGKKYGVLDFDAREVLPCVYESEPYFSDGLFLITENDASEIGSVNYWYLDENGQQFGEKRRISKTTLDRAGFVTNEAYYSGQFAWLAYSDGLAPYIAEDGLYGYIDKSGRTVIPAQFPLTSVGAGTFTDGAAIITWYGYAQEQSGEKARYSVINKEGWEIIPKTMGDIFLDNGMLAVSNYHTDQSIEFYSPEGALVYKAESGSVVLAVGYGLFRVSYIGADGSEQGGALVRAENGRESELLYEYSLDQAESEPSFQWEPESGAIILTEYVSDGEFTYPRIRILGADGETAVNLADEFSEYTEVYITRICGKDKGFSEPVIEFALFSPGKNGEYTYKFAFYTISGRQILPPQYKAAEPVFGGEFYVVQTELYSGCIRSDGQWLVKCTALDYMAD